MKTKEVKCIGYLYILGGHSTKEYLLIEEIPFADYVTDGRRGWNVIDPYSAHRLSGESDMVYSNPRFVASNAPWYVDYHEQTVTVEDDTPTDDFEPTPSPDDPDWESIFKEEDKQNTIEAPDPE